MKRAAKAEGGRGLRGAAGPRAGQARGALQTVGDIGYAGNTDEKAAAAAACDGEVNENNGRRIFDRRIIVIVIRASRSPCHEYIATRVNCHRSCRIIVVPRPIIPVGPQRNAALGESAGRERDQRERSDENEEGLTNSSAQIRVHTRQCEIQGRNLSAKGMIFQP